jgi:hypothetical protein
MQMRKQPNTRWLKAGFVAVLSVSCVTAWAQSGGQGNAMPAQPPKPARVAPPPADLEPGVNTSATSLSSAEPAATPAATPVPEQKPAQSSSKPAPAARSKPAPATGATATTASAAATSAPPKPGASGGKAHDRLELDTTQITGNRELPKVLYIVPWKRSDLGDLVGKPVNSLLDEVLTPVDRDVFKRQNRYYDALKPDDANQAPGTAAGSGEKH